MGSSSIVNQKSHIG